MKARRPLGVEPSRALALLFLVGLPGGCSLGATSDDEAPTNPLAADSPGSPGFPGDPFAEGASSGGDQGAGGAGDEEPEVEREASYRAPVVTGRYVWSANPDSGRVAVIDAESFEIRAAVAGLSPTEVAALPTPGEQDAVRAVVLNHGSADATLITMSPSGLETRTFPTHEGADSWAVSASGGYAIAWTDARRSPRLDPTDGMQDITVLDLTATDRPRAVRLTVGYRPTAFYFDESGEHAYGITQDGISVIDLSPGDVQRGALIELPASAAGQPDVTVLPDGSRALARLPGVSSIYSIDLGSRVTTEIALGGSIRDLDVSEDGRWAVAVRTDRGPLSRSVDAGAPLADAGDASADAGAASQPAVIGRFAEAVFIPLPEGLSDEGRWQRVRSRDERLADFFGSVSLSPDGRQAVLFTTTGSSRVTLVDAARESRTVDLLASVRAVFITADGSHAVALQEPPASSQKKGAFSLLSLAEVRAPKRVASDAPAEAVALSAGSDRALVTVSDPDSGAFGAYLLRMPSLQVDFSSIASRPLATGTVPVAGKAYVAQAHPEGRITFIDMESGEGRDITGFELAAKVVSE